MSGIATDGAPAMAGKKEGLIKLIEDEVTFDEISLHQISRNLCATVLKIYVQKF